MHQQKERAMKRLNTVLQMWGVITVLGLTSLALPLPAHARVNVSVGIGVPVVVAPVQSSWLRPQSWSSHCPWAWAENTAATLSADTTIGETTGTRVDTGDLITTTDTVGKQGTPHAAPQ